MTKNARRTQAERLAETRRALLDSAIQILQKDGYIRCTLKRVASDANLTTGAVQYHFKTREALIMAVMFERLFPPVSSSARFLNFEVPISKLSRGLVLSLWKRYSDPNHLVVWDIIFSTRHQPALWTTLSKLQMKLLGDLQKLIFRYFEPHGITSEQAGELQHFILIQLSGLALMKMQIEDADVHRQIDLLIMSVEGLVKWYQEQNASN